MIQLPIQPQLAKTPVLDSGEKHGVRNGKEKYLSFTICMVKECSRSWLDIENIHQIGSKPFNVQ